jgi:hypothetical protein
MHVLLSVAGAAAIAAVLCTTVKTQLFCANAAGFCPQRPNAYEVHPPAGMEAREANAPCTLALGADPKLVNADVD